MEEEAERVAKWVVAGSHSWGRSYRHRCGGGGGNGGGVKPLRSGASGEEPGRRQGCCLRDPTGEILTAVRGRSRGKLAMAQEAVLKVPHEGPEIDCEFECGAGRG